MKIIIRFILFLVLASAAKCEKPPGAEVVYSFWVRNTTAEPLSFLVSRAYPDTSISVEQLISGLYTVPPHDSTPYDEEEKWEKVFADLPRDTLSIFFFDKDTLNKYPAEYISENYKVLERREITLEVLKRNNFRIDYP